MRKKVKRKRVGQHQNEAQTGEKNDADIIMGNKEENGQGQELPSIEGPKNLKRGEY